MKLLKIHLFLFFFPLTCSTLTLEEANKQLNAANNFFSAGKIENAFAIYNQLHKLFPKSIALLQNSARAAYELNDNAYARQLLEQALTHQPENAELHYQYALSLLTAGDYTNGWREYEWRWKKNDKKHVHFPYPQWHGEPLANKRILLISEGDYGDIFQFVRFAITLKKYGTHITLYTKKELIPLLRQQSYLDDVVSTLPPAHTIDYWISLMSIPAYTSSPPVRGVPDEAFNFAFKVTMDTLAKTGECRAKQGVSNHEITGDVTIQSPYITIDDESIARNKKYINPYTFNIGICWHADPTNDANRPPLARRSIDRALFDLFLLQNVTLYPLEKKQYGYDFDSTHGSFIDTAALITQLDLIITVDTAIAHLAGALGKPTWVLLPYKSDWRWMLDRNDTPWYPTMKLFRNNQTPDWQSLCMHVAHELDRFLKESA